MSTFSLRQLTLDELRRNSSVFNDENQQITVPIERQDNEKPVRKITFAPAFGPFDRDGHPAPDPLLLAVKAALNWSAFHEEPLMVTQQREEYYSDEEQ